MVTIFRLPHLRRQPSGERLPKLRRLTVCDEGNVLQGSGTVLWNMEWDEEGGSAFCEALPEVMSD